jgi:serine/threonine protein kinase/tetratricopeptide (TPR) repeat protein
LNWTSIVKKEHIGSGSFGDIFKVTNRSGDTGALKMIHREFQVDRLQFKSTFRTAKKIHDKNCCRMYDWISDEDISWVMEYIDGKPISSLKFTNVRSLDNILKVMIQVCNGLITLHSRSIIHRDLKPENILIDLKGVVKITDFDFIKTGYSEKKLGVFTGTPEYSSPEHFISSYELDTRSDLYCLGVILYELLTGELPFTGKTAKEIGDQHRLKPLVLPTKINPQIPAGVEKVIIGLLEKDPNDRYQHAHAVAKGLFKEIKNTNGIKLRYDISYLLKPKFVNRVTPLKTLNELSDELKNKNGNIVLILGESGIGKSKLIQQFYYQLQLQDIGFYKSICKPVESSLNPLYMIFKEIISDKSENEKLKCFGKFGWDLVKYGILSEQNWMKKIKKPIELSGQNAEIRLFAAITDFLKEAAEKPLVICIDDLHWADKQILKWLQFAERDLRDFPVLIIGLHRSEQFFNDSQLLQIENLQQLFIKNLKEIDISEMIRSMLGSKRRSKDFRNFIENIVSHTNGNPLFIRELLYHLNEKDMISIVNNKWEFPKKLELEKLPDTIQKVIQTRLQILNRSALRSLQIASIIGKKFDFETLLSITKKVDNELLDDLIDCREVSLIEESSNEYVFIHDKIREVLENELKEKYPSFWKELHLKAAEFLEEKYSSNLDEVLDEVANHFFKAENFEKSADYLELAGDNAEKNYQNETALEYYDKLIKSLRSLLNIEDLIIGNALRKINEKDPKSILLLKRLAKAYYHKSNIYDHIRKPEDAISECKISLTIAERTGDKEIIRLAHFLLGWCYSSTDKALYTAINHYEVALELSEELDSNELIAYTLSRIGTTYTNFREYDKAREYFSKSHNLYKQINNKNGIALSYLVKGRNLRLQGHFDKGIEFLEKGLKVKKDFDSNYNIMCVNWNLGNAYQDKGEFETALKYYFRALEINEEMNETVVNASISIQIGYTYYYKGEYERALDYFRSAEKTESRIDLKIGRLISLRNITDILCILKKYPEAKNTNKEALELAQKNKDKAEIVKSKVMAARISFFTSKTEKYKIEKGINPLEILLKQERDEEQIALLNFELWKMKNAINTSFHQSTLRSRTSAEDGSSAGQAECMDSMEENRKTALKFYHKLYNKEPIFHYKYKYEELERQEQ